MTDLYLRDLVPIVEMQALELRRLMRDKERLSEKIDSLISEIGSLRALQQQDRSLRESEHELRSKMQQTITDLIEWNERTGAAAKAAARPKPTPAQTKPVPAKPAVADNPGLPQPSGRADGAKTAGQRAAVAVTVTPVAQYSEHMEIPAFLANGPRVGFDSSTAEDIREIHGPSRAEGEAPIKKLLARIRARNGLR